MKVLTIIILSLISSFSLNEYFYGKNHQPSFKSTEKSIETRNIEAQELVAKYTMISFFANCVSLIVSISGIIYVVKTLNLNKKAIETSEKSIHISKEGNILANRAWLSIECQLSNIYRGERSSEKGVCFEVFYSIKNHGNTPASRVNVHFESDMYIGNDSLQLTFYIHNLKNTKKKLGQTIYPNQKIDGRFITFIPDTKINTIPIYDDIKVINPAIYGSVFYNIFGEDQVKSTSLMYILSVHEDNDVIPITLTEDDWITKNIQLTGPMSIMTE